jgi:alpha-L-fucosidase 2
MTVREPGFVSGRPAEHWEHGLVAGNGALGALVLGQVSNERIVLTRAGLFMPFWEPVPTVPTGEHLPELRQLLRDGQYQRAAELVIELDQQHDRAGDRWTDPLIPACELQVRSVAPSSVTDYARGVDFDSGVVSVNFSSEHGHIQRRLFVSRADNVVVLSISATTGVVDCDLALTETAPSTADEVERHRDGIGEVALAATPAALSYLSHFRRSWPGSLRGHVAAARVVNTGGRPVVDGTSLQVRGATEVLVLLQVARVESDGTAAVTLAGVERRLAQLEPHFQVLFERHQREHARLFQRVRLDLGGTEHAIPTEQLLARASVTEPNPTLVEKQFDAARYAILASSGELPPTLQGLWSGTYCPPWSSDYTNNGNLPTAIAGALCGNQAECLQPFLSYHWSKLADYRSNAQRLYGCRGIFLPSRTSSHGLNNHFNVTWTMTFWTAGAAWAAHFFYDYYLYTGDVAFLRERAVPFMQETLLFYEDFLERGPDGKWTFNPSYSPENAPGGSETQACVDATMDMAIARELCSNLLEACNALGDQPALAARARAVLDGLPDYRINADGAVAEWLPPQLADNHEHRHLSHLYALYDGLPPEIEQRPELLRAFHVALERRLQIRKREGGGIMAFGLAQLGFVAASLGDAAVCQEVLCWLSAHFFRSSLVTTHDPGTLFNVDLCGGFPALLIRCLVDSWPGRVDLLKALPPAFSRRGSLEGAACRGRITVKRLAWTPESVEVTLESAIEQAVTVRLGVASADERQRAVTLAPGEPLRLSWLRG